MTPVDFLTEIVLPTVREFESNRRSRRRAYLAVIVTFTLKDHLAKAGERGIETTMRAAVGDAFDLVRSVANGAKHLRTDGSHVIAFTAGEDYDRPPAWAGEMECGVSELGDETGGRRIGEPGNGARDLYVDTAAVLRAYVATYPVRFPGVDLSDL